jgi:hypothetical protein
MNFKALLGATILSWPATLPAQLATFHNTERGRPFRVEDASPIPRYAVDLTLLPAWKSGGDGQWALEPGLTYGLLSRTQIDVRVPILLADETNWSGAIVGAQHTLNVETRVLPIVALDASMLIPAGFVENAHPAVAALATKTFRWGRLSMNSEASFGDEPTGSSPAASLSRWQTGAAVDWIFSRAAWLGGFELVASQPLESSLPVKWRAGAGLRYQLDPALTLDAGVARHLTGSPRSWRLTAGISRQTPAASLLPGFGRWGR